MRCADVPALLSARCKWEIASSFKGIVLTLFYPPSLISDIGLDRYCNGCLVLTSSPMEGKNACDCSFLLSGSPLSLSVLLDDALCQL